MEKRGWWGAPLGSRNPYPVADQEKLKFATPSQIKELNCILHLRLEVERMFLFLTFLHNTTTSAIYFRNISKRPELDKQKVINLR